MSPRTDSYSSLCLEQASKSTLHYRHGCIIVRGGKVIGQGYNDYRPGFNGGGTLKTGRFATGASSSPAILALKQGNRSKSKSKSRQSDQGIDPGVLSLAAVETSNLGRGGLANSPLSMHSEMMAIQSALSLSSNTASYGSARSSTLMQKPGSHKLPGRGKRQLRLRILNEYVDTICGEAIAAKVQTAKQSASMQRGGEAQVRGSRFGSFAPRCGQGEESGLQQQGERERAVSHKKQYCVRPQEVSVCSSASVSASLSGPPPPHPRCGTTTRTTAAI